MSEPVNPARTATFEKSLGEAVSIKEFDLDTGRGIVAVKDAPGYSTALFERPNPADTRIGFILYNPKFGTGLAAQMTPDQARMIASSLLRLAMQLDPRGGH